jgi:4-hydroxy-tetrahydrodipicolinate reductase
MDTIIFGTGNLGRAIAATLESRDGARPRLIGRPVEGRHQTADLGEPELAFVASSGTAVLPNVEAALAAGCRTFVIGTTAWDGDRAAVDEALRRHGATAVVSPNFSLGVACFLRLVDTATSLFGGLDGFDPYVLEWHRRDKADRPSGTAREIARRIIATHPGKTAIADPAMGAPAVEELEVVAVRAGASPGMHVVGFDAAGETVELRLTARDRGAYAAGAVASADWLRSAPRRPGLHRFEEVVDDLLATELPMAVAV